MIQLELNNRISSFHGSAPFAAIFLRSLNEFNDHSRVRPKQPTQEQLNDRLLQATQVVFPALQDKASATISKRQDRFIKDNKIISPIQNGTLVMIRNISTKSKLEPAFEGPYTILRQNRGGQRTSCWIQQEPYFPGIFHHHT